MPTAGTRLGSHEVLALIGQGGMGLVYEAEALKLRRFFEEDRGDPAGSRHLLQFTGFLNHGIGPRLLGFGRLQTGWSIRQERVPCTRRVPPFGALGGFSVCGVT